MTTFTHRVNRQDHPLPASALCDAWLADGHRFGDAPMGLDPDRIIGRWPAALETDAIVRLAKVIGANRSWEALALTPPVSQQLADRARPLALDQEIVRLLPHLQRVCHQPRLHLRVEEERLPVARARRTPVRAVAELVSHPGDWEHRTLRSIQPSRVLARQIEDEWNLYENRVAVRLVDHLLAYLAKRLEELRKIKRILDASRDHSDEMRRTSFRRSRRLYELWSDTLEARTESELPETLRALERAQRHLQALLDAPLYPRIPRHQAVALALKPTNILVNDTHYRKVAALWRAWVKFGHKGQETTQERADRRAREAAAWDQFVLQLVVRGLTALGWDATLTEAGWQLTKPGWLLVRLARDAMGGITLGGAIPLRILPICANFSGADPAALTAQVERLDGRGEELVLAHVGDEAELPDADRAAGWSTNKRTVLFACSPWSIDAEERMTRLLHGYLARTATPAYPALRRLRGLPPGLGTGDWLRQTGDHLAVLRTPTTSELTAMRAWTTQEGQKWDRLAQQAKVARQPFDRAPMNALSEILPFIEEAASSLGGLNTCPVCETPGRIEPRLGQQPNGADATFWASCQACRSQWGTRRCTGCDTRYRAILPHTGLDDTMAIADTLPAAHWPDKVFGRDLWAQPCATGRAGQLRCPGCGQCMAGGCKRCQSRSLAIPPDRRTLA